VLGVVCTQCCVLRTFNLIFTSEASVLHIQARNYLTSLWSIAFKFDANSSSKNTLKVDRGAASASTCCAPILIIHIHGDLFHTRSFSPPRLLQRLAGEREPEARKEKGWIKGLLRSNRCTSFCSTCTYVYIYIYIQSLLSVYACVIVFVCMWCECVCVCVYVCACALVHVRVCVSRGCCALIDALRLAAPAYA